MHWSGEPGWKWISHRVLFARRLPRARFISAWRLGGSGRECHTFGRHFRGDVDATVGAVVVGRRTFDLGVGPWGGTPWPGVPSFVITHRARQDLLGNNGGTFAFDGLQAAVRRAKQAAGDNDVFVLGADVARQLLRADLLDEIRIHLVPLLLGEGTPMFDGERAELIPKRKARRRGRDPSTLPCRV